MKRPTFVPLLLQQRINIFFAQKMGVSMAVTVKAIEYVYGRKAMSKVQIRHWFKLFKNGRTVVVDLPRHARHRCGRTPGNIQTVKTLLENDRRLSISAVSHQSGLPWSTCRCIITLDLGLVHKTAKFVPHLLQEQHLAERLRISKAMLQYIRVHKDFLKHVVTMDESWVYTYDLELKSQSTQWLRKEDPRPIKSSRPHAVSKVLLVSFFGCSGLIHREFPRRTVTSKVFVNIVSRLRFAVSRKRGHKYLQKMTLHMDNASPHTSKTTRAFLMHSRTKVLEHPAYSPDLAPSDFWFFPRLKRDLWGHRFQSLEDLEAAVDDQIMSISSFEFEACILTLWPKRWARCVNAEGIYFEGIK